MKRTLFENRTDSIWIKIEVTLSDKDQLIVSGCDSGKIVQQIKGRYDYEYFITIEKDEVKKLVEINSLKSKNELMDWFVEKFKTDKSISEIKGFLKKTNIRFKFSAW